MQKKIIVLAIAGTLGGLATGSVFADMAATPNVSFYGVVDYGYLNRGSNSGAVANQPSTNSFDSGINSESRIGAKGVKELANGSKALFEVEYGITVDNNGRGSNSTTTSASSPFWNRHSYVGLTGDWGTAVGGRLEGARYTFT
ncbi:MAG: porin, partial [Gallionella sp.]